MTHDIKTGLTEDTEANETQCRVLQMIRAQLTAREEDGDLALRQVMMPAVQDDAILDLKDDIFDQIEIGTQE